MIPIRTCSFTSLQWCRIPNPSGKWTSDFMGPFWFWNEGWSKCRLVFIMGEKTSIFFHSIPFTYDYVFRPKLANCSLGKIWPATCLCQVLLEYNCAIYFCILYGSIFAPQPHGLVVTTEIAWPAKLKIISSRLNFHQSHTRLWYPCPTPREGKLHGSMKYT